MYNYSQAFQSSTNYPFHGSDPKSGFSHHQFINKGDLIHNNLDQILLHEEIREYSVLIDSKDRNYQVYPNPFQYDVIFKPSPKTKIVDANGKTKYLEDSNPTINKSFDHVRYIKLETVLLPLYTKAKYVKKYIDEEQLELFQVDPSKLLSDHLYVILSLGEHSDANFFSTNDILSDSFATIYYDKKISNTHYTGFSANGIKIFPQDQLGKINRLRVNFTDPYGIPITCDHMDRNILSNMECICENSEGDEETDCYKHNLSHPLNPIFQHHLHFKVGVIEPRMKKNIFT